MVRGGGVDLDQYAIELSMAGEPEAFADVVRRNNRAVHAYFVRRVGRPAADDLVGDVWTHAFGGRKKYDARQGTVLAWLYGIAHNTLRGYLRRREPAPAAAEPPADVWADVDDRIDAASQRTRLVTALERLNPVDRELFLLVAWEQLTPSEAAVVLKIPQGTARSRLHRARAQLREELDFRPLKDGVKEIR